jgi:hypothetical protein
MHCGKINAKRIFTMRSTYSEKGIALEKPMYCGWRSVVWYAHSEEDGCELLKIAKEQSKEIMVKVSGKEFVEDEEFEGFL